MVNLTIRLGKAGASPGVAGKQQEQQQQQQQQQQAAAATAKGLSVPPHLVDTDLPLLKGVGTVFSEACALNLVGVKARRRPGDKVHICVRCNFPIAVYGRLLPCEHVFCLTCAKLDPSCFLCEERVTRIQKMDVLEGIFICGAPGCLRSFLARPDFDLHIIEAHPQLLQMEQQGGLSPERNVSAGNASPEAQAQSHQSGQQHTDFAPPTRQPSGNLQVIHPKKEEPQRRPPKAVRQDPAGLLGRPVPELRLPDQFPHHRAGDQPQHINHSNHLNRDRENDANPQGRDQKPRRRSEWDMQAPQGQGELEQERMHEGGSNHTLGSRKKDGDKDRGNPPPPLFLTQKHKDQPPPPPPPYPAPPNFYLPQQDGNSFPSRFDAALRGFHPGMPRPEYQEGFNNQNGPLRPPPVDGYGQNGLPRPMNGSRPHFYPEYGPPPMGMSPMGAPRYHEGHLPPPPPPGPPRGLPPLKRTKFSGQQGPGEPMMEYNNQWGPGNPGHFVGGHPGGGHSYPNWMPPANS